MKIFNNGGSGGTPTPSVPWEEIILSGEDLESEGYKNLDSNLILTKAEAPKLYEIYKKFNGDFIFDGENTVDYKTVQISKNYYMAINRTTNQLIFSDSITFINTVTYNYSGDILLNDQWQFCGQKEGVVYINEYENTLKRFHFLNFNKDAADLTELLNSITIESKELNDWGISYRYLVFANNYIYGRVVDTGGGFDTTNGFLFFIPFESLRDEEASSVAGSKSTNISNIIPSNELENSIILQNDAFVYNGTLYKIPSLSSQTIYAVSTNSNLVAWYDVDEGKDYFQYSGTSGKLQGLGEWDGINFNLIPLNYGSDFNRNGYFCICYIDQDRFLDSSSSSSCDFVRISGVRESLDSVVGVDITSYFGIAAPSTSKRDYWYSRVFYNYRFDKSLMFRDSSTNKCQKVLVLEDTSETFEIKALLANSDDKKYWIKIE